MFSIQFAGFSASADQPLDRLPVPAIQGELLSDHSSEDFEEQVHAQAFAISMMCWNSYTDDIRLWEPYFAWDATGWYAAWLYRTQGVDLLSQSLAMDFQRSIGVTDDIGDPAVWLGCNSPKQLRNADGSLSYDFSEHKLRMDELLGVELALSVEADANLTETVTVSQHFGYRMQADTRYLLRFAPNTEAGSLFPYQVAELTIPTDVPEMDPALGFSWELLVEQNQLETILSMYPAVRIYSKMYNTDDKTWLFLHGEDPVLLTDAYGSISGQIRGCYFDMGESTDGVVRPRVSSFDPEAGTMGRLNSFIEDYFTGPAVMEFDCIEDDLIWTYVTYRSGYRQKLAFDRGTLVLREAKSLGENGEVVGITGFDYSAAPKEYSFLDSWDRELRSIDVLWETYPGGIQELRRETVRLPMDWEYLPFECRWGEFTAYTNDQYIGDYRYPGDGIEYMLFFTTVKG